MANFLKPLRFVSLLTIVLPVLWACSSVPQAGLTELLGSSSLRAVVDKAVAGGFRGSVLVADASQVLHASSHGPLHASAPDAARVQLHSTVRLASITKQVVSTLVLQSVESGRLSLDGTIEQYWPDYPNIEARGVTVRQLLMHQSGLANPETGAAKNEGFFVPNAQIDVARWHAHAASTFCALPMAFKPGQGFTYNNCDYLVLGALLERVEGQPFASLLRDRVLQPADMQTAFLCDPRTDVSTHVRGSEVVDGKRIFDPAINPARYGAAGALCGTVADVLAYNRAWHAGKLLKPATKELQIKANEWSAALGVWRYTLETPTGKADVIERQGWIHGVRWVNLLDQSRGISVIVMTTQSELDLSLTAQGKGLGAELLRAVLTKPQ